MAVLSKFEMNDNNNNVRVTVKAKLEIDLNDLISNHRVQVSDKVIDEIVGDIGTSVREFVKQERICSPPSTYDGKKIS